MRLLTAQVAGRPLPAVLNADDALVDLHHWGYESVLDLIQAGPEALDEVKEQVSEKASEWKLEDVQLLAPIPHPPRNIFCVGANYRQHIDEGVRQADQTEPQYPVFFTKPFTALRGSGAEISFSEVVASRLDWEAEIAAVVGRRGANLSPSEANDYVVGLVLANDLSARDLQLGSGAWGQWFKGKSLDGSCPMGPFIVTMDEFGGCVPDIEFRLLVNGEEKQHARMSEMIHDIASIVSRLSLGMEILPGDLVLTGTCSGVGLWRSPQEFLADGDRVTIEAEPLGRLESTIHIVR